jgi:predicted MPP superfamily phosphohydrolase
MNKYLFALLLFPLALFAGAKETINITHGPYLQNLGTDEAVIVWTTDRSAVSWVEIAPDDSTHFYLVERPKTFAARNGIKLEGTVHAVKLRGLSPNTRYRYRVFSQEVLKRNGHRITYGNAASTSAYTPFTFTTLHHGKPSVDFVMVNDIHGRSELLEKLLELTGAAASDMVFFNGDMVSSLAGQDDIFTGFMDAGVKSFASNVPMYYARGNHETRGIFAHRFQDYFSPLSRELYCLVRQGPACFVVLDCGEDKPDSDIEYSGITDYDAYRSLEAQWLAEALRHPDFTGAAFRIVICHMPPERDWHGEAEILNKFVPLLNKAGIDLMLCGHVHRHIRKPAGAKVKFPVLVNSNNAAVKATVSASSLSLQVINPEGKLVDSIEIRK